MWLCSCIRDVCKALFLLFLRRLEDVGVGRIATASLVPRVAIRIAIRVAVGALVGYGVYAPVTEIAEIVVSGCRYVN